MSKAAITVDDIFPGLHDRKWSDFLNGWQLVGIAHALSKIEGAEGIALTSGLMIMLWARVLGIESAILQRKVMGVWP